MTLRNIQRIACLLVSCLYIACDNPNAESGNSGQKNDIHSYISDEGNAPPDTKKSLEEALKKVMQNIKTAKCHNRISQRLGFYEAGAFYHIPDKDEESLKQGKERLLNVLGKYFEQRKEKFESHFQTDLEAGNKNKVLKEISAIVRAEKDRLEEYLERIKKKLVDKITNDIAEAESSVIDIKHRLYVFFLNTYNKQE